MVESEWLTHTGTAVLSASGGAGLVLFMAKKYFESLHKEDQRLDRDIGRLATRINEVDQSSLARQDALAKEVNRSMGKIHTRINQAAEDLAAIKAILERDR